jgi:transposase
MSVIRHGRKTNFVNNPWLGDLVHRKPTKVAAVALANKIARTAWVVLATGETYRQPVPAEA